MLAICYPLFEFLPDSFITGNDGGDSAPAAAAWNGSGHVRRQQVRTDPQKRQRALKSPLLGSRDPIASKLSGSFKQ